MARSLSCSELHQRDTVRVHPVLRRAGPRGHDSGVPDILARTGILGHLAGETVRIVRRTGEELLKSGLMIELISLLHTFYN